MKEYLLIFLSGYGIGILGGFHCLGMCGSIALTLPINQLTSLQKTVSMLLYNFGRAFTYTLFGLLFGLIGLSFSLFKVQQFLSIFAGVCLLFVLVNNRFGSIKLPFIYKLASSIKSKLGFYLKAKKTTSSYFYIGLLNGFLPCGLVYVALAASIATGTILKGGLLMFGFGLGTIPIMASLMYFGKFLSQKKRANINRITPILVFCMAVLLIIRGLNLDIPYLSPSLVDEKVNCCHK